MTVISTNAKGIFFAPKNNIDHIALKNKCTINSDTAVFTAGLCIPNRHTRYAAIPINIYSTVHTGPNTQFGGLNDGRANVAYHVGIAETVKNDPIIPAASHNAIHPNRGSHAMEDFFSLTFFLRAVFCFIDIISVSQHKLPLSGLVYPCFLSIYTVLAVF